LFKGKFNISRFNTGHFSPDVQVVVIFSERLEGLFGIGTDTPIEVCFHFKTAGNVMMASGIPESFIGDTELWQSTMIRANVPLVAVFSEDLTAKVSVYMDINLSPVFANSFMARSWMVKDIHFGQEFFDGLLQRTVMCADMSVVVTFLEMFECVVYAVVLDYQTAQIAVTIPPGGELRLDSGIFTAMLDTQNVLHSYSGNWINLKPGMVRLDMAGVIGGTGLTAQVLYNERYL